MYIVYICKNLCKEAVHKDGFGLSEAVAPEHCLQVVGGVPAGVKYDHSVGCYQVDPQRTSSSGDEEETQSV